MTFAHSYVPLAVVKSAVNNHSMSTSWLKCIILFIAGISILPEGLAQTFKEGVLDLRETDLSNNSYPLDGFWQFYPNQFVGPDDGNSKDRSSFIRVPSWWSASDTDPSIHFATYRIRITLSPSDQKKLLALKVPAVYSSYELIIDGIAAGGNGKVGTDVKTSLPQWKPHTYPFQPKGEAVEIIIHLSNFDHSRTGINESLYIGDATRLTTKKNQTEVSAAVLFFALWLFAMISLGANFFTNRKDKALIYFACICVTWSFRSVFSNYYLAVQWFPDLPWVLCVKVEYITLYLSTLFGALLIGRLFPRDVNRVFTIVYAVCCVLFTLFTLATAPVVFTHFVQVYIAFSSVLLVSILVVITKAYIESRQGLSYLIACLLLAVIMFAYVILAYQGLFELNALIFNAGFFLLFFMCGIAVGSRLNKMATTHDYDIMTLDEFQTKGK